jgi:hypothetical protein
LGVGTTISGSLTSAASSTYRLEFFANTAADSSGSGQGQNFVGATNVTTNSGGSASFSVTLPANVPAAQIISATATDSAGNTSAFAHNVTVSTTDSDGDGIPNAWTMLYFGHPTGQASDKSRAPDDADGDGLTNLQEFLAGTNPLNASSAFRLSISSSGQNFSINLPSVQGIIYRVQFSNSLSPSATWETLTDQILGTGGTMTVSDPGAAALPQRFYRAVVLP